ncbi:MAG: HPr family phosphocarrier protein [Chloroflexi bacterium]|nr:HPr family phosphocarrier protein [Chloroflexota bacterium]
MVSNQFIVENEVGLHARPAALFVQTAAKFKSKIKVRNATRGTSFMDAKSRN